MSDSTTQTITQDEEVLQFTQGVRRQVVDKMTEGGQIPVEDPKQMGVLLATLDGMDRVALTKMKIKSEENLANQNQAAAAAVIAQLLQQAGSTDSKPFQVDKPLERPAPQLGNDIPAPQLVPGEIDVMAPQGSFEAFEKRFSPDD